MARTVAIGAQDFEEIINNDYFYIDKTSFIKEWWEAGDSVTLITRPRRFGKTLNMSMLDCFFSVEHADRNLFEGLRIWKEKKYRDLQGTYPVIFLSFARIKEKTFEKAKDKICEVLRNVYIKYSFVRDGEGMTGADRNFFDRVLEEDMKETVATSSLYQLSDFLYRYYGKKVIILLDEYDTPMEEAYIHGYWEELVDFTRSLFNSTFKTNPHLARGMMTGITRVSKESIFSDLNNPQVVTTTSDMYSSSFGFTEDEVFAALSEYGYIKRKDEVRQWYDGFVFGKKKDIYNPWSIINFLKSGQIKTYWANTSSNGLVSRLLQEGSGEMKNDFETLLHGENIWCPIDEQLVYDQLDDDEDAVWSLLIASGYLKVVRYEEKIEGKAQMYELALTNGEVRDMFFDMVRGWFKPAKSEYRGFVNALLACDLEAMNEYLNRVAGSTFSYFDTENSQPERFYHGFVLGLLVDLEGYRVTSNRESGFGRYDVMIEPEDVRKDAFILEFKVCSRYKKETLEDAVAAAHAQMEEKNYGAGLIARGIPAQNIHKFGFAFLGKKVLIG